MRGSGRPADAAASASIAGSVLDAIGRDALVALAGFLPSLPSLFDVGGGGAATRAAQPEEENGWQLILSLTKILTAVLESGRYVMIVADDLQWANKTSLSLIDEVLCYVGVHKHVRHRCLFVGLYRSEEVDDAHPLSSQRSRLEASSVVDVTEIQLSSLSKEDVLGMLMEELRLPRRLVVNLADLVHKKTAGHALFVVELLNSLLRDSIVTYSVEKRRYDWDDDRVDAIRPGDSVAELLASNVESLPAESRRTLRILSCFGSQTDDALLRILERFHGGVASSIDGYVEMGILDRAACIVVFTHDLIRAAVYESMSEHERTSHHLQLGEFLGAAVDEEPVESVANDLGQCSLKDKEFFSGRGMTSSLLSIACDQLNAAGPNSIIDRRKKIKFATWNNIAGQSFVSQSNFSAALFYFSGGIAFLGQDCWCADHRLCLELFRGAVLASFALGEAGNVEKFAREYVEQVPFERTFEVQEIFLKALAQSERHQECILTGIAVLQRLGLEIPLEPSKELLGKAVVSTSMLASLQSSEHMDSLCGGTTDDTLYAAARIVDGMYISLVSTSSPLAVLISCEMVKLSLKNGCCLESALSFATFASIQIFLANDYDRAKYWADYARKIIKNNEKKNKKYDVRVEPYLLSTVDIYFTPPRDISSKMIGCYHDAEKIGQVDSAMLALFCVWKFKLLGGHNLSLIMKSFKDQLELVAKHSNFCKNYMILDGILLMELTGQDIDIFSVYTDTTCSLDDLRSEAIFSNDIRWLHDIYTYKMLLAYWRGDYLSAEENFHLASLNPTSKMPRILSIYRDFFGGLVSLYLHREQGSKNSDKRLKHGEAMMHKLEKYSENAMVVFNNKWRLLQAEYSACVGEHTEAQRLYLASINAAKDHGNIHELALAYELMGNHLCSMDVHDLASEECFRKAHVYYDQWGATAISKRLVRKHGIDLTIDHAEYPELRMGRQTTQVRLKRNYGIHL